MWSSTSILASISLLGLLGGAAAPPSAAVADRPAESPPPPAWLRSHMEMMVADSGLWVADNSAWKSADEPFEAYAMQWQWGIGRQSIVGRLFGLRGGKASRDFWEFRLYWHPGRGEAVPTQFGGDGTYGQGTLTQDSDGNLVILQEFVAPDGSVSRSRHVERHVGAERIATQYSWSGTEWVAGRSYTWKRR
jgi:hypothetical protein